MSFDKIFPYFKNNPEILHLLYPMAAVGTNTPDKLTNLIDLLSKVRHPHTNENFDGFKNYAYEKIRKLDQSNNFIDDLYKIISKERFFVDIKNFNCFEARITLEHNRWHIINISGNNIHYKKTVNEAILHYMHSNLHIFKFINKYINETNGFSILSKMSNDGQLTISIRTEWHVSKFEFSIVDERIRIKVDSVSDAEKVIIFYLKHMKFIDFNEKRDVISNTIRLNISEYREIIPDNIDNIEYIDNKIKSLYKANQLLHEEIADNIRKINTLRIKRSEHASNNKLY